ncbi:unnamed protein product [Amoebophrya sp. A25]|nr:unnamed protein product [Amoebophrya sp. A25]|eukprot:GSA25T00002957001.1
MTRSTNMGALALEEMWWSALVEVLAVLEHLDYHYARVRGPLTRLIHMMRMQMPNI